MNGKRHIAEFLQSMKVGVSKCLDPTLSCKGVSIRAHSVQNAQALDLIAEDNHVQEIRIRIREGKPTCEFASVGRNNASTFTGLCAKHDAEIFRAIDTKPFDPTDAEQLFLIAYRAVTREFHATLEGAIRIQGVYQNQVAKKIIPGNVPTPAALEAVMHMMKAWGIWKYRIASYDKPMALSQFGSLRHSVFMIQGQAPVVAAASLFSADDKAWGEAFAAVVLNIVPTGPESTAVVFSYAPEHAAVVERYIEPVTMQHGEAQKLALSHLLVNRAENFFLKPSHVAGWPEAKRRLIESEFESTVTKGAKVKENAALMLF